MIIPELKVTENFRKYEKYSINKRSNVVYNYLFRGKSHRWLDEHILGRDSSYTRGWESMAILHHLGLVDTHKGLFKELTIEEAIRELTAQEDGRLQNIVYMIKNIVATYSSNVKDDNIIAESSHTYGSKTLKEFNEDLEQEIQYSRKLRKEDRDAKLQGALKIPRVLNVTTQVYQRNPDVVITVLERANGICERCGAAAPFIRASDGTPYLEVHHKIRLADGGEDTIENAIGVCPNCHRELHFGVDKHF